MVSRVYREGYGNGRAMDEDERNSNAIDFSSPSGCSSAALSFPRTLDRIRIEDIGNDGDCNITGGHTESAGRGGLRFRQMWRGQLCLDMRVAPPARFVYLVAGPSSDGGYWLLGRYADAIELLIRMGPLVTFAVCFQLSNVRFKRGWKRAWLAEIRCWTWVRILSKICRADGSGRRLTYQYGLLGLSDILRAFPAWRVGTELQGHASQNVGRVLGEVIRLFLRSTLRIWSRDASGCREKVQREREREKA